MKPFKKYLLWFANEHVDFRLSEVEAIISLFKSSIKWCQKPVQTPFWIVELSPDVAHHLAERSVTLKHITELWAHANTMELLHHKLKNNINEYLPDDNVLKNSSFKIDVHVYCNTQTYEEKIAKIESFTYLPYKGPVKLKNPDVTLEYIEYYGNNPSNVPKKPYDFFFGKLIANSKRRLIHDLSLKTRIFIGNTTMDPELSLIMANQAKISKGDLVLDPFVGSGSLLIAAAYFGAYVMGVDINFLMLHGRTKPTRCCKRNLARNGENVEANMRQYGLQNQYLDVLVADSSIPIWRSNITFDAIITDPPYGVREPSEKIGFNKPHKSVKNCEDTEELIHYPSKVTYEIKEVFRDVLNFSAMHLKIGGRLVIWIPVFRHDYSETDYTIEHSCFTLISSGEQILSGVLSRRLLTFEKIKQPTVDELNGSKYFDLNFRDKYLKYRHNRKIRKPEENQKSTLNLNTCVE